MANEDVKGEGAGSGEGSAMPGAKASEAWTESGRKAVQGGSAVGVKLIDQAEQNASEAFAAMRKAAGAKDMAEVMKIQAEFLQEQSNRAMAQAREISDLIVQFGKDAASPRRGGGSDQG
jgi:phasin family protein